MNMKIAFERCLLVDTEMMIEQKLYYATLALLWKRNKANFFEYIVSNISNLQKKSLLELKSVNVTHVSEALVTTQSTELNLESDFYKSLLSSIAVIVIIDARLYSQDNSCTIREALMIQSKKPTCIELQSAFESKMRSLGTHFEMNNKHLSAYKSCIDYIYGVVLNDLAQSVDSITFAPK